MLELIKKTGDIKKIPENRLDELAGEIRNFMISSVSETGGHLASNLGTVELTIALHRVYDLPEDKIIWDVGHQAYTHKILTGRKECFSGLRKEGGISGFPRRSESDCDSFDTGHSSTSISAGLGYVEARDITGENYKVVSIIGDGALTGGLAYEALNNAAELKTNFVIILNDNEMSISRNVGGMSDYLSRVRTSKAYTSLKMSMSSKIEKLPGIGADMVDTIRKTKGSIKQFVVPGMLFENMGLTYLGPANGHDIRQLENILKEARTFEGPVLVHVITEKGKGYLPASRNPVKFHGVSAFKLNDGYSVNSQSDTYTNAFSRAIVKLAREDKKIAAVTAAMKEGTGLKRFSSLYPERFFDVGIAEGHAVTFAAGLSLGGLVPVVAVYSSFLQRAFDQLMIDVCMQKLHVVFAIDRAGFVGADGKTHQGCFDISYLCMLPNMTLMAPKNEREMEEMLVLAAEKMDSPAAIRYPKGQIPQQCKTESKPVEYGKAEIIREGSDIMIWAVGNLVSTACMAAERASEAGYKITVVNARFIKPFDKDLLKRLVPGHKIIMTLEENVSSGGFGSQVLEEIRKNNYDILLDPCAVCDTFVGHGTVEQQREHNGLDVETIAEKITAHLAKIYGDNGNGCCR